MAKETERSIAREMYVEQGKTAVEIERITGVTEKTIGVWVKKYGWKEARDAKLNGSAERLENVKRVISDLTEQRLEIIDLLRAARAANDKEWIYELNKSAVAIDDGISKWNKTLINLDKANRITLSVYLEVFEDIFKSLQNHDNNLYLRTLDFQEGHVSTISLKLG